MEQLKEQQVERKNREGHPITMLQPSSSTSSLSLSSSDSGVEALESASSEQYDHDDDDEVVHSDHEHK